MTQQATTALAMEMVVVVAGIFGVWLAIPAAATKEKNLRCKKTQCVVEIVSGAPTASTFQRITRFLI